MGATFDLHTEPGSTPVCSRAGCSNTAAWRVNWRNPRIHSADRVKIWAACEEHRDFLADYLRSRTFPVRVTGMHEDVDRLDDERDPAASPKNDVGVRSAGTGR
ncbi:MULTISPECIES: hypothetical protein [unclassified Curtobacterium]|uniref:hypothetical protein n=1 Tax=unclassified Curtobacterium TaxID=257496 RepID=UPI000FBEF61B|nr:hypothetical protein EDF41_1874 [Curtobacterium sp. PhB171]ROQ23800.1 hypothetical protein EDF40_2375 [Curtobacterium sp. PhB170]ROS35714.1 hypothetical protein EDF25_1552 [Curtobacterium sp. PhB131]ROS69823.1 hypothetical protein EDF30_1738 [Curtobacterium sp. PhB141]